MPRRIALLACALLLAGPAAAARGDALVEVPRTLAPVAGVELTGHAAGDGAGAIVSAAGLRALRDAGVPVRVIVPDLAARDRADRAVDAAYAARVGTSPLPSGRTGYRRLGDFEADLDRWPPSAPTSSGASTSTRRRSRAGGSAASRSPATSPGATASR
jgi:hypothetical protein